MYKNEKILIGKSGKEELYILPQMANRHGIITGASGSGKTITLKVMSESFSDAGVPVFFADVKGDLGGTALSGEASESLNERLKKLGITDFEYKNYPVRFWDIFGEYGLPIRTTIDSVGPDILSMMLGLSEIQESVLNVVFKIARDHSWELDDIKDLRLLLQYIGDNRASFTTEFGNVATQTIGVIQRCLLTLDNQGADKFFGLPALDIYDLMKTDMNGKGYINILHAVELFKSPDLYAAFLLWFLTELFTKLPEVGDLDKPKMVFFFDEAHILFNGMPNYRLKQIVQVVKLIRSRGVGVYFVSQSPADIPSDIMSQLGNRVQHTLRAYTPNEQKVVKAIADDFRANPDFNTYDTILNLGTGEAVISFLNENGEPGISQKATILPPQSKMGTIDEITRNKVINMSSEYQTKYAEPLDRESAYEELDALIKEKIRVEEEMHQQEEAAKQAEKDAKEAEKAAKQAEKEQKAAEREAEKKLREAEKARKSTVQYKLGKKVANKTADKLINKGLDAIFKHLF
ncbi:MAG: DUF853 family protein [Bacilli bacterium]|nr:DUF853 family protein [Bacilli bacterium]